MITVRIPTRDALPMRPVETSAALSRADKFAETILRRWLGGFLTLILLVQFAGWLPHYLTWPWWGDHDVFATLALGWDRGVLPYRDAACNNFPGSIYVFWVLGHTVGWGWTPAFNAVDAALLIGLGAVFVTWGVRRLGGRLPGTVGFLAVATYYFGLNYALAGQRDWQGPCLALASLLIVDGWPRRATFWLSAVGLALAFVIRPQVILLGPAFVLALDDARRRREEADGLEPSVLRTVASVSEWALALALGLVLGFLPLLASGIMGDFVRSLRVDVYGGAYNQSNPITMLERLATEFTPLASWCVPGLATLLAARSEPRLARLARTALVAYFMVALYKPLSPMPAPYLDTPLRLVWSVLLALIVGMVSDLKAITPALRLAMVLAVLPVGINTQPQFCSRRSALTALRDWRVHHEPVHTPPGYTHSYRRTPYPWGDYRRLLGYLRTHTQRTTRIANALKHDPAIAGSVGRLPAFPTESLAWIRLVNRTDEPRFTASLERADDSVVVWSPAERNDGEAPGIPTIYALISTLYAPEARFGAIEVWRRKPAPTIGARAPAHVE